MVSLPREVSGRKMLLESVSEVRNKLPAEMLMLSRPETVLPLPPAVSVSIFPASLSVPLMAILLPLMKDVLLNSVIPALPIVILPAVALPIVISENPEDKVNGNSSVPAPLAMPIVVPAVAG